MPGKLVHVDSWSEIETMTEGVVKSETFLDYLRTLPWCKQGDNILVAVHKGTPEVLAQMPEREVKVFPGGIAVKMQKSVISNFQSKYDEGQPLPVVLVWKPEAVEIWYRKIKPTDFPYDAWSDTTAAAYEQERVLIPAEDIDPQFASAHAEVFGKVNACPSMMPQY